MPRSKTGAGPGLNGAFSPKKVKSNPRPGQNLVLKIDWTGANFSTKQPKTEAKLNAQNRLDPRLANRIIQDRSKIIF